MNTEYESTLYNQEQIRFKSNSASSEDEYLDGTCFSDVSHLQQTLHNIEISLSNLYPLSDQSSVYSQIQVLEEQRFKLCQEIRRQDKERLAPILQEILSIEDYSMCTHETPYTFHLLSDYHELLYFGSYHSCDPKDSIFAQIEEFIDEPDIVFIEGIDSQNNTRKEEINQMLKQSSYSDIITEQGEPGFTIKRAAEKDIEWHSPEPDDRDIWYYLETYGYTKDSIFAFEIFRVLPEYLEQVYQSGKYTSFKQYTAPLIKKFKENTDWQNFDYSYHTALATGKDLIGLDSDLDIENIPSIKAQKYIDPVPRDNTNINLFNHINQLTSQFRDQEIVYQIVTALEQRKKVLVVFGASHAVMQQPALKKFFEQYV